MRPALLAPFLGPFLLLAACEDEPENIQTKAENLSRELERKEAEIANEAENSVAAQIAPLDNEAEALLNRLDGNGAADADLVANAGQPERE